MYGNDMAQYFCFHGKLSWGQNPALWQYDLSRYVITKLCDKIEEESMVSKLEWRAFTCSVCSLLERGYYEEHTEVSREALWDSGISPW